MKRTGSVIALICLAFVPFLIAAGQVGWEGKTGSSYPVQSASTLNKFLQSTGVKGAERWNNIVLKDYATFYAGDMTDNATNPASSPTMLTSTATAICRNFQGVTANQAEWFYWMSPVDMSSNLINFKWGGWVSNATAPAAGETIIFKLACTSIADSTLLSRAVGTAVGATFTESGGTHVQYDRVTPSAYSADVTVANWVAGDPIICSVTRFQDEDTYATPFCLSGLTIKFTRTLAP